MTDDKVTRLRPATRARIERRRAEIKARLAASTQPTPTDRELHELYARLDSVMTEVATCMAHVREYLGKRGSSPEDPDDSPDNGRLG